MEDFYIATFGFNIFFKFPLPRFVSTFLKFTLPLFFQKNKHQEIGVLIDDSIYHPNMFVFVQTWGLLCYEMAMLAVKHGDSCDVRCFLVSFDLATSSQWPFQDPIDWKYLHVPTIYFWALFFRPKFQGISPQFIWPNIWYSSRTSMYWILENSHRSSVDFLGHRVAYDRDSSIGLSLRVQAESSLVIDASAGKSSLLVHVFPWKWHHYEPWKIMKDKIDHG